MVKFRWTLFAKLHFWALASWGNYLRHDIPTSILFHVGLGPVRAERLLYYIYQVITEIRVIVGPSVSFLILKLIQKDWLADERTTWEDRVGPRICVFWRLAGRLGRSALQVFLVTANFLNVLGATNRLPSASTFGLQDGSPIKHCCLHLREHMRN